MSIITLPAGAFKDVEWTAPAATQVNQSEFTHARQVMTLPGAPRWSMRATLVTITGEANFLPWRSFIRKLRGRANSFRMLAGEGPQRTGSNPTASAAAAGAVSLTLNGLPASATVLKDGHAMTVRLSNGGEQLVTLSADLVTNGAGVGVATFEAELRTTVTAGAVIETIRPWCLMASNDDATGWTVRPGQKYNVTLAATEV